jgi:rubrerythrin
MKTLIRLFTSTLVLALIFGFTVVPVSTVENLKAAYNGESNASAKYAAFAEKAKSEGFANLAIMFHAISKSESIHARNHKEVLEELGEKVEEPTIGPFKVLSTAENIADAIKGETYEVNVMYPEFILTAKNVKANSAVLSFTNAFNTEKKHQAFYTAALESLKAGKEKSSPAKWYICSVCGNTFDAGTVLEECDFCMEPKDKFIVF